MKYLLVLLVVFVGFLMLKRQFMGGRHKSDAKRSRHDDVHTLRETEPMMRCTHCGVFLPRSAALRVQGRHYCSQEHAQAAEKQAVKTDQDKS
jgi:uncharacterized protein